MFTIVYRSAGIILMMLFFCAFHVSAEYQKKEDTLNYSDDVTSYSRKRLRFFFNETSDVTYSRIKSGEAIQETFSALFYNEKSPFAAILGNYQMHMGSGLLCGKKRYSSSDPFTQRFNVLKQKTAYPVKSGNAMYSFMGPYAAYTIPLDDAVLNLSAFYSYLNIYLPAGEEDDSAVDYSLHHLQSKIFLIDEPADLFVLHNYGFSVQLLLRQNILMQLYSIHGSLTGSDGSQAVWNDFFDEKKKNKEYHGAGFFVHYKDSNLTCFADVAGTAGISGSEDDVPFKPGFASIAGLAYNDKSVKFESLFKYSESNFYSPYSSDKVYPENFSKVLFLYKPFKGMNLGGAVYMKDHLPYYGDELSHYLLYSVICSFTAKHVKSAVTASLLDQNESLKYKVKATGSLKLNGFFLDARGMFQWGSNSGLSWLGGSKAKLILWKQLSIALSYYYASIKDGNSLYAPLITDIRSVAYGEFIFHTAHLIASQLKWSMNKNSIFCNFRAKFSEGLWSYKMSYGVTVFI